MPEKKITQIGMSVEGLLDKLVDKDLEGEERAAKIKELKDRTSPTKRVPKDLEKAQRDEE